MLKLFRVGLIAGLMILASLVWADGSTILPDLRPSDYEYARLSQHVYHGKKLKVDDVVAIADNNWRVTELRRGGNNYFGVLCVNHESKEAVLSHRGTDSFGAVVDDIEGVILNL